MGIENFIEDALYKPNDYIGYHVGRRLAELHPEKSVVAGVVDGSVDLVRRLSIDGRSDTRPNDLLRKQISDSSRK